MPAAYRVRLVRLYKLVVEVGSVFIVAKRLQSHGLQLRYTSAVWKLLVQRLQALKSDVMTRTVKRRYRNLNNNEASVATKHLW